MLDDRARIQVQAGAGGNGCVSFRREAHVPRGGPDGGDGGRGGDIVFVCDESLRDLRAFRRRTLLRAGRGGHGEGALRHGADGETLTVRVPPGTQIFAAEEDGGDLQGRSWELLADGAGATVARGGSGGKGNKRFASSTHQTPRFAERGLPGEQGWLQLRLRLLADVGLVGLPNAGKSSLLASLTRARPKVADYPFTTLSPVLGVIDRDGRQLVVADIPGLIEGASTGAGLGHDFLAHVERTRLLVHVLDLAPELTQGEGADPVQNHATIERELAAHDPRLAALPRLLALSKADLLSAERVAELVQSWRERLGEEVPVIATSAATGAGTAELEAEMLRRLDGAAHDSPATACAPGARGVLGGTPAPGVAGMPVLTSAGSGAHREPELAEHMVFRPRAREGFRVERTGDGAFAVRGRGIERLLERFDLDNEDALAHLEHRLRTIGVIKELEAQGFEPGDEVEIAGVTFELDPG